MVSSPLAVSTDHPCPVVGHYHVPGWRTNGRFHDDVAGQALHGVCEVQQRIMLGRMPLP